MTWTSISGPANPWSALTACPRCADVLLLKRWSLGFRFRAEPAGRHPWVPCKRGSRQATLCGNQLRLRLPPEAARTTGPQERRQTDASIPRSAPLGAAAPLPRGPDSLRRSEPTGDRPRSARRSLCHGLAPAERATSSHTRRHYPSRPPRAQVQHAEAERPVMCSVTAMRPVQIRALPDAPRLTLLLSRARRALMASWPFASHSNADAVADNGSGRRRTSVCAGQNLCRAPRRNRTGDPILTMDWRPSAVLARVIAGRPPL
jgi:hypothetical protein